MFLKTAWERLKSTFERKREGQFLNNSYDRRAYKIYIPARYRRQAAAPLLVMLHGCSQDPDDFALGTEMNVWAERFGCIVVYPEQPAGANPKKCWNWFSPMHQARDKGEPAAIVGLVEQIKRDYAIDNRQVYVAGLSAGACMTVILGATYPDVFAAVGACAGMEYKAASSALGALTAMRWGGVRRRIRDRRATPQQRGVPLIVFHGTADNVVTASNSDRLVAQWALMNNFTEEVSSRSAATDWRVEHIRKIEPGSHPYTEYRYKATDGKVVIKHYLVEGMGHCWPGGSSIGSYTDPGGPQASRLMLEFFLNHRIEPAP
ncbi:MAG: PHB depolymerase family esterase [Chloroflexales bacterium]|nr:PHB depolymerase family esterase [Chloroflexales bacterium]